MARKHPERPRSEFDDLRHGYACFTELARAGAIASLTQTDAKAMHRISQAYHMRFLAPYEMPVLQAVRRDLDSKEFTKDSLLSAHGTLVTPEKIASAKVGIENILAGHGHVPNPLEQEITPTPSSPRLVDMLTRLHELGLQSEYDRTIRTVYAHPEISSQMTARKGERPRWLRDFEDDATYFPEGLKEISSNAQKHLEILDGVAEEIVALLSNGGIIISHWERPEGQTVAREAAEIVDNIIWQEHGNEIAQYLHIDFATQPVREYLTNDPAIREVCAKFGIRLPEGQSTVYFVAPQIDHMLTIKPDSPARSSEKFYFGKDEYWSHRIIHDLTEALEKYCIYRVERKLEEAGIQAQPLLSVQAQPMITDRDKDRFEFTLLGYPVITTYDKRNSWGKHPLVEALLHDVIQMHSPDIPDTPKAKVDRRTRGLHWFRRKTGIN